MNGSSQGSVRTGYTLLELIVALAAAAFLVAGASGSIFIALQASDPDRSSSQTTAVHHALIELAADLQFAQSLTEQTATAITAVVPDRNADTFPETIRYSWSGVAGDPLTRQYNGGAVATIASDVHDFQIQYHQPAAAVEYAMLRLQISSDSQTRLETAIAFLNRP